MIFKFIVIIKIVSFKYVHSMEMKSLNVIKHAMCLTWPKCGDRSVLTPDSHHTFFLCILLFIYKIKNYLEKKIR